MSFKFPCFYFFFIVIIKQAQKALDEPRKSKNQTPKTMQLQLSVWGPWTSKVNNIKTGHPVKTKTIIKLLALYLQLKYFCLLYYTMRKESQISCLVQ